MKKIFTPEALVGLLALIGMFIVIYLSLEVSETNIARGKAKTYYTYFDTVTGVVNKSPIETAGIRVGYIDDIKLDGKRAKVTIRIVPDLVLHQNATLWIKDRGILGDKFLKLDVGTSDYPVLKEGETITRSFSESDLDKLTTYLGNAAKNIDKVTKALGDEAEKGSFNKIIKDIESLTNNLSNIVSTNKKNIDNVISNIKDITDALKVALGYGGEGKHAGENIRNAMASLEKALASFAKIAEKIDKGEGTIGKLVSDEKTAKKFQNAIDGISNYVDSAKNIQTELSYRGEYLTDSKKLQNAVAITIKPKPDKYIKLELIDAPRGPENQTETTVVLPDGTVAAQTKTVESKDTFLFSLELAKRFYDLNVRFGIIRNEGGVGFDYYFLKDLLELSFEAFDFSRYDNRPRIRSYATMTLYRYFQLTGGVNDMIDRNGNRDFFFGAGFSLTDNDLKTILTSFKIPGL